MQSNKNFGEKIKQLRKASNMTQDELGEKMYCNRYRIMDLERGKSGPTIDDIVKLCNIFDVSADYLLGLSDVKSTKSTVKSVCKYTGLSEKAVLRLNYSNTSTGHTALSSLIADFDSFMLTDYMNDYKKKAKQLYELIKQKQSGLDNLKKYFDLKDTMDILLFRVSQCITKIVEAYAQEYSLNDDEINGFLTLSEEDGIIVQFYDEEGEQSGKHTED